MIDHVAFFVLSFICFLVAMVIIGMVVEAWRWIVDLVDVPVALAVLFGAVLLFKPVVLILGFF